MADTDFFDDDLLKQREGARRIKLGPGDEPPSPLDEPGSDEVSVRPIAEFNLTRMARLKKEMTEKSAQATQDLERLRRRQEEIEREKRDVEELRHKMEEYERGRRDLIERFSQSLVTLEKEEVQAQKLSEMLASIRKRFKMMLLELQQIREECWPEDTYRDELTRALSILENARQEYNRSMARLEVVQGERGGAPLHPPPAYEEVPTPTHEHPFGYWIKVGLAVSLPIMLFLALVVAVILLLRASLLI